MNIILHCTNFLWLNFSKKNTYLEEVEQNGKLSFLEDYLAKSSCIPARLLEWKRSMAQEGKKGLQDYQK